MTTPSVLNYSNYRQFLKDLFEFNKKTRQKYSYRQFAADLGLTASNFLHLVVSGKRNLSPDTVSKFQKFVGSSAQERKYFAVLVDYNQTSDVAQQTRLKKKLDELRGKKRKLIDSDEAKFFMNWYIPVLREIVCLKDAVPNLSWISKKIQPSVPQDEILEGLKILERLGYIKKAGGRYIQSTSHLTTSTEVESEWILRYHSEMIKLAEQSLQISAERRDVSSMTIGITQAQFDRIKQKIIAFRDEIQQEIEDDNSSLPDEVAQLNIQFFPLTKK